MNRRECEVVLVPVVYGGVVGGEVGGLWKEYLMQRVCEGVLKMLLWVTPVEEDGGRKTVVVVEVSVAVVVGGERW